MEEEAKVLNGTDMSADTGQTEAMFVQSREETEKTEASKFQEPKQTESKESDDVHKKFLAEALAKIQTAIGELQEEFNHKISVDTHKNQLFDNMHRELIRYQNGAMDKIVDSMALDMIQLIDDVKKNADVYEKKESTEENYGRLLKVVRALVQDMVDILYRQGVEPYQVEGDAVDTRRQKIIQTVETDIPERNNLVAVRVADGYEKEGKVLRPERIKIYKYREPSNEKAAGSPVNNNR